MEPKCDWVHARERCESNAVFLCGKGHALCSRHTLDARGEGFQRATDRICGNCGLLGMIAFMESSYPKERRAVAFTIRQRRKPIVVT